MEHDGTYRTLLEFYGFTACADICDIMWSYVDMITAYGPRQEVTLNYPAPAIQAASHHGAPSLPPVDTLTALQLQLSFRYDLMEKESHENTMNIYEYLWIAINSVVPVSAVFLFLAWIFWKEQHRTTGGLAWAPCSRLCLAPGSHDPGCTEHQHGLQQLCPAPELSSPKWAIIWDMLKHTQTSKLKDWLHHTPSKTKAMGRSWQQSFHCFRIRHGDLISARKWPRAAAARRRTPIETSCRGWHSPRTAYHGSRTVRLPSLLLFYFKSKLISIWLKNACSILQHFFGFVRRFATLNLARSLLTIVLEFLQLSAIGSNRRLWHALTIFEPKIWTNIPGF